METEVWNDLQIKVFSMLVDNKEGISSKEVIKAMEQRRNVWEEFYKIIGSEIDSHNPKFKVFDVSLKIVDEIPYLVIRNDMWDFIIIDLKSNKCLSFNEVFSIFDRDFFTEFSGIDEESIKYLDVDVIKNSDKVIEYFIEHKDILLGKKNIRYVYYDQDRVRASISIPCDTRDICVSINEFISGRCNYLFLDTNLKVYGASNLTGKKEEIAGLFNGENDIFIPIDVLGEISNDVSIYRNNKDSVKQI